MPIVENKATPGVAADRPYCTYSRTTTLEPNAVLTPQFAGEIVLDTGDNCLWQAKGIANTTWVLLTPAN